MRLESDEAIAQLLVKVKRIALVGASAKPDRPSHRVMHLLDEGYEVFPSTRARRAKLARTNGDASLADLPTSTDMADIFRDAASLPEVTQDVVDAGIPAMWTQLGVVHSEAEQPPSMPGASGGGPLPSDRNTATARGRATPG